MPFKKKHEVSTNNRKRLYFTSKDERIIPALVINGMNMAQIAEVYGCSEATFKYNLGITGNEKLKEAYRTAVAQVLADTTITYKKLAEGYEYIEREWKATLDSSNYENLLKDHKDTLISMINDGNVEVFANFLADKLFTNITDIKVSQKYAKPDLGAVRDITRAHNAETWDLEGKHKKITQTKYVVTIGGEPQRRREIKPDFVVEA